MGLRELLPYVFYAASFLIVLWDVFLAGQIAQLRRAPRFFRGVTALAGLLVAPAILIAVTSASILNGRAIYVIAWVWPLTLMIFALQALYAVGKRLADESTSPQWAADSEFKSARDTAAKAAGR